MSASTVLDCLMHHDHSCAPNQFYNGYILCPILCICPIECMIPKHDFSRYFVGMGQCGEIQNLVLSHGTSKIGSDQILFTMLKQNGCTWDCKITCIPLGHIIAISEYYLKWGDHTWDHRCSKYFTLVQKVIASCPPHCSYIGEIYGTAGKSSVYISQPTHLDFHNVSDSD